MRALSFVGSALVAFSFLAVPALAAEPDCTVFTVAELSDVNYTTVCKETTVGWTDGTQTWSEDRFVHVAHAVEADPAFDYAHVWADQGTWVYDDGEVRQEREYTHVSAEAFEGVRGLAGGGFHVNLHQRDQTSVEDGEGACASHIGRSTCFGAGAWWTFQDVASVGGAVYYQQTYDADGNCSERFEVDVDVLVVFVPVPTPDQPCTTEMPWLYDEVPFREIDVLP